MSHSRFRHDDKLTYVHVTINDHCAYTGESLVEVKAEVNIGAGDNGTEHLLHDNSGPYLCTECGKWFIEKHILKRHT